MVSPIYQVLFSSEPPLTWILVCMSMLVLSSALLTLIITTTVYHSNNSRRAFFCFLWIIQIIIPVLGYFIVIMFAFLQRRYHKNIAPIDIATFKNPIYIRKTPVEIKAYGEGWANIRLGSAQFHENERKQALISLSRGAKRHINLIYHQLVSDEMEELRICAFSLLENQQNYLHEKINALLKLMQKAISIQAKAFYAKQLALLYWEFVYLNLGEHEFRKIILEKSQYYAQLAMEYYQQDPCLLVLLSRIAIANRNIKQGLDLLKLARFHHAPTNQVYPYLAEESFRNHAYSQVREYLSMDPSFQFILKINQVIKFWCTK